MSLRFVLSTMRREFRSSRRRLGVFMGSIALGVAALVSINSFRENVATSIRGQSRVLLGADLELRSRSPLVGRVRDILDSAVHDGVPVSEVTSFASMALAVRSGLTRLVDVRAVEGDFPFYGTIETAPEGRWSLLQADRHTLVDSTLLVQLGASIGDTLLIGESRFAIIGAITRVPGELGILAAIGPRVYIPGAYLDETGLVQFGSRARYTALLRLDDDQLAQFLNTHRQFLRDQAIGIDTAAEREEDLTRSLGMLARYLGLVGLVALLLGGIGVASAVHVFVKGKLDTVAVFRALGATQRTMFAVYLGQATVLSLIGALVGAAMGAAVQAFLPSLFAEFLPLEVSGALDWSAVAAGLGIGVWLATMFALYPLLDVRNVPPLKALRSEYEAHPRNARVLQSAIVIALVGSVLWLSVWQAPALAVGLGFAGGIVVTAGILWIVAFVTTRVTRRLMPARAPFALRQGFSNLFRPHNQTMAVTMAVGFGVFLLATLYVVQWNLLDRLRVTSYPERPNLVLFDIQPDQREDVESLLRGRAAPIFDVTPIVSSRLAAVNGRPVQEILQDTSAQRSRWPLTREYRNTYRDTLVASEAVIAGSWWDGRRSDIADTEPRLPRISLEEDIAAELDVGLGDRITWNIQGRQFETVVASIRRVDWARFETNFFAVFEPGVLEDAPQSFVTLTRVEDARQRAEIQRDLVLRHANVSAIDLTLVQQTLDRILDSVALAIRFMALFSIGSGLVVLVGAITTSRFQRLRESALLKTLGARSRLIRQILFAEYMTLGTLSAFTGVLLAAVAGWALTRFFFELPFRLPTVPLLGVWLFAAIATTAIGLVSSREVTRKAPLVVLREMSD